MARFNLAIIGLGFLMVVLVGARTGHPGWDWGRKYPVTHRGKCQEEPKLWPNGVVLYTMDPRFTRSERKMIKAAMRHIEHHTCIFFCHSHRHGLRKTLHITFGVGCSSKVGYRPLGTEMRLGVPCFVKVGTVVHELLHSLGLHHEHQRFDSHRYIKINFNCIKRGHERNFMPQSKTRVLSAGIPYDYDSILHYGRHTYSKRRRCRTIQPL
ncbi:hypothetical protein Pcinc_027236 [Petrolisthes cinctipes]|uniref:Metalloendopeptidase n=1 Tax=Petrolisthes cinctipes TaxID=88211 RepID=A0AAE1F4Y5_PETCI|nr:hypothetical protein Pcinc_027236 [Petrolisthes cinctipes]